MYELKRHIRKLMVASGVAIVALYRYMDHIQYIAPAIASLVAKCLGESL